MHFSTVYLAISSLFALSFANPVATTSLQPASVPSRTPIQPDCFSDLGTANDLAAEDLYDGILETMGQELSYAELQKERSFQWRDDTRKRMGSEPVLPRGWRDSDGTYIMLLMAEELQWAVSWLDVIATIRQVIDACVPLDSGSFIFAPPVMPSLIEGQDDTNFRDERPGSGWALVGKSPLMVVVGKNPWFACPSKPGSQPSASERCRTKPDTVNPLLWNALQRVADTQKREGRQQPTLSA